MPTIPAKIEWIDPTLMAVDDALEAKANRRHFGGVNLGMSMIGNECERQLWYSRRWATKTSIEAKTQRIFEDGYSGEDLMAERLRMVDGITLITEERGRQIKVSDHAEHFQGRLDGEIVGLKHEPEIWHVWEHKQVGEKVFRDLQRKKEKFGMENALKEWKPVYYAQAILYMHYTGLDRHYCTVTTPGGRDVTSIITHKDVQFAQALIAKAKRVITSDYAPPKISDKHDFFGCRFCDHQEICHMNQFAPVSCRTCLHADVDMDVGGWTCTYHNKELSTTDQREGCPSHLFLPDLVPGRQVDSGEDWVSYELFDGREYVNKRGQKKDDRAT